MSTLRNKALAHRFYEEVFSNRKLHLLDELVGEEFIDHNPDPGRDAGIDGLRKMLRELAESFPDLKVQVRHCVAEGDLVGAQLEMTGTHQGEFAGIPATGRYLTVRGFDWVRIKDGKCVERWGVFDDVGMMQQLGAAPGPSGEELKKLSRRYYELLDEGKGDLATLRAELFHPMNATYFAGEARPMTPEGFQGMLQPIWQAFPDLHHEIVNQICEGDTVYNHMKLKATHRGEFAGVAATHRSVEVDVMTSQTWREGRLYQQTIQPEILGILQQIGAIPEG